VAIWPPATLFSVRALSGKAKSNRSYKKFQGKLMQDEDFLDKRLVVYEDDNYHRSWISVGASSRIVGYLSSEKRKEKFEVLDAREPKIWIEERLRRKDSSNSCVVFAQDMVPDILARITVRPLF
jgi:hypothetical protein